MSMTSDQADAVIAGHRLLQIRSGIITRCRNPNSNCYESYGGRGIDICEGWATSPKTFAMDMGLPPTINHSVDRIDSNGWYSCGHCQQCVLAGRTMNCRWATDMEQANNRRSNRHLTRDGLTMTVAEWARELGIEQGVIYRRLAAGDSEVDALRPVAPDRMMLCFGRSRTISEWAEVAGMSCAALRHRIDRGMPVHEALLVKRMKVGRRKKVASCP